MATQFGDAALPEAGTRLPTFSDDRASSVVIPDSGFIKQQLNAVHSLPFQPLGRDLGTDIVIGRASDDRYTAGVGWEDGDDNVKLSLLRQQSVGDGFDGLWLTSLQGEFTPAALDDAFDLTGELALAAGSGDASRASGGSGIRLNLARKPSRGFSYGLTLSQFSESFHPYGSVVEAGERRAAANLSYAPWSGTRMTATTDYILGGWDGAFPCDEYRTGLALSSVLFTYLRAKLETFAQRALDCGDGNIDSWALTLSERHLTGWNLSLVAGISEETLPFMDELRVKSHYRVSGDHDLRLGPLWASFGPEVSLQTITDSHVQRRLQTGFVMGFETRTQDFSLHMGYESLSDSAQVIEDTYGRIKLKYRLDFDA